MLRQFPASNTCEYFRRTAVFRCDRKPMVKAAAWTTAPYVSIKNPAGAGFIAQSQARQSLVSDRVDLDAKANPIARIVGRSSHVVSSVESIGDLVSLESLFLVDDFLNLTAPFVDI